MTNISTEVIGKVIRTHGLSGRLHIQLSIHWDNLIESIWVQQTGSWVPYRIVSAKVHTCQEIIIYLEGVEDRTASKSLVGCSVGISTEDYHNVSSNYAIQYIGYTAIDTTGELLGVILDVYNTPQYQLLSIDHVKGELLIPSHDVFIKHIDKTKHILQVQLPLNGIEGLLSLPLSQ